MSHSDTEILTEKANSELEKAQDWLKANKLTLNVKKTKFMIFSETKSQSKLN